MKKFYVTTLLLVMTATAIRAQVMAIESQAKFQGAEQPTYVLEVPYSPEITTGALKNYLDRTASSKGASKRGVLKYAGVNIPVVSGEKLDLYATVEKKSRKEKNSSVVRLYISKGYDNFISSRSDASVAAGALRLLNDFPPEAESHHKTVEMKAEAERIRKEEKAAARQEAKIRKMEKQLEKTKDEHAGKKKRLERKKAELLEKKGGS